jgi:hypothetical protein
MRNLNVLLSSLLAIGGITVASAARAEADDSPAVIAGYLKTTVDETMILVRAGARLRAVAARAGWLMNPEAAQPRENEDGVFLGDWAVEYLFGRQVAANSEPGYPFGGSKKLVVGSEHRDDGVYVWLIIEYGRRGQKHDYRVNMKVTSLTQSAPALDAALTRLESESDRLDQKY